MNASSETPRLKHLFVWVALPGVFILAVSALSILGSSTPNHTPPPEFDKLVESTISARAQP
jgi:hypothetical protein